MIFSDYFLNYVNNSVNQKLSKLFINILLVTAGIAILVIINRIVFTQYNYLMGDLVLFVNAVLALILIRFASYKAAVNFYLSSVPLTLFVYFCLTNFIFPSHMHPKLFTEFTLIATFHMFLLGIFSESRRLRIILLIMDYLVYVIILLHFLYWTDQHYDSIPTIFISNGLVLLFASYFASFMTHLTRMALSSEQDLKVTNEFKNKLFSIVSHDLRSPFLTLQARLHMLQAKDSEDQHEQYLAEIIKNSDNIAAMLDNLLHWSKLQFEGGEVKPEQIDLAELSRNDAHLFGDLAGQKAIEFECTIKSPVYAYADKEMVHLVMRNLISNAIKYSKPNSRILFSSMDANDHIEFSVSDSGIGFSDDQLNQFSINRMKSTDGTDQEKGSGIGLLLSKDLVQRNGGEFHIQQKEIGTTVVFTLPKYFPN
ncbi:MAG: HAMP domain-containing histidine kinase [Calditrichaeota bacterium]|nr:HAMP domain-containing histidine kinase [Calditrichota bacterium]